MPRKKTVVLTMVAAFGFGFYQGAQMLSFVVGHYTSNPFSLFGLFVEGAVYLAFACPGTERRSAQSPFSRQGPPSACCLWSLR